MMKKSELRTLGFEEDKDLYEFYKRCTDKKPRGGARVELNKNTRVGKFYWDEIRIVYGSKDAKKPFLEIKTQNGLKIIIYRNVFEIWPYERMDDTCYLRRIPTFFDVIEFYLEFEWIINIEELIMRN